MRNEQHIFQCRITKKMRPGHVLLNDFHFERPKVNLEAQSSDVREYEKADYEIFDYPGEYRAKNQGETYARNRKDADHLIFIYEFVTLIPLYFISQSRFHRSWLRSKPYCKPMT